MAGLKHPVVGPDVRDRLLTRTHRSDEVGSVIFSYRTAINFLYCAFGQRIAFHVLDRFPRHLAAIDEEAALCSLEQNAIVSFAGDDHRNVARHVGMDFKLGRRIVLIGDGRMPVLIVHR